MHANEMNKGSNTDSKRVIVGLGATGLSCARYFHQRGMTFSGVDSRLDPPGLQEWRTNFPAAELQLGELDCELVRTADELIVGPGLDSDLPALAGASARGATVHGDLEIFFKQATAPLIAITGSNGKSTVTSLLGQMATRAGLRTGVGGNLGPPVLDLLDDECELYVLELSSFQLETVHEFRADVALFLNFCPDHLDRYGSLDQYLRAKQRVYQGARQMICNRDDPATTPPLAAVDTVTGFTLEAPEKDDFGLLEHAGSSWIARGPQRLIDASEIRLQGRHNLANVLAALAAGTAIGLEIDSMLQTLRDFEGLVHRSQLLGRRAGVQYVNDSKATNVGAAVASVRGLSSSTGRIVLIAGGIAKETDFTPLRDALAESARAVVLIGQAAPELARCFDKYVDVYRASDMNEAVVNASNFAQSGDTVLLAPACASFDMFGNFAERGESFIAAVSALDGKGDDD